MKPVITLSVLILLLSCAPSSKHSGPPVGEDDESIYGVTSADLAYIRKETVDGKLDFVKKLPKDYKPTPAGEKIYSRHGMALFMWGAVVHEIGVSSGELAIKLYEDIRGRVLKDFECNAIIEGFNSHYE
jgi:hypothetical protein